MPSCPERQPGGTAIFERTGSNLRQRPNRSRLGERSARGSFRDRVLSTRTTEMGAKQTWLNRSSIIVKRIASQGFEALRQAITPRQTPPLTRPASPATLSLKGRGGSRALGWCRAGMSCGGGAFLRKFANWLASSDGLSERCQCCVYCDGFIAVNSYGLVRTRRYVCRYPWGFRVAQVMSILTSR